MHATMYTATCHTWPAPAPPQEAQKAAATAAAVPAAAAAPGPAASGSGGIKVTRRAQPEPQWQQLEYNADGSISTPPVPEFLIPDDTMLKPLRKVPPPPPPPLHAPPSAIGALCQPSLQSMGFGCLRVPCCLWDHSSILTVEIVSSLWKKLDQSKGPWRAEARTNVVTFPSCRALAV